jgi:hypothetical protein
MDFFFLCFCSWTYHIAQNFMNNNVYIFSFFLPSNGMKFSKFGMDIVLYNVWRNLLFLHFVFVIFHLLALGSIISKTSPFTTLNFFEHVTKTNPLCDELHVYNYMIIFLMIIKINYFVFNN